MQLLIVDDEPMIRYGLLKMTESYSPAFKEIRTAEHGLDALEKIRKSEPDIVLTDIRMPKMDGLELCRTIHDDYPHIQTVVISGYGDFDYAQKCIEWGVKHYLLKPVTRPDVHEVLDRLIHRPMRGYVSVSRYVEWIDRMEGCIWSLQTDELNRLIAEWRHMCLAADMPLIQLKELLADCIAMLTKRLQERRFTPETIPAADSADSAAEVLDAFGERLRRMAQELLAARKGNFKDPMEEARAYIDSRLSQDISLEEVAGMVGLTPTYFSALFKKMTSETFVQYRINRRMEKAKELLSVPHLRISDIAPMVGYDDYPHFTKTFKKIVGLTPSEYRAGLGIR